MQLVPVLEIRHGKGVHTQPKNNFVDEVVKEDVISIVQRWLEQGVRRIHIVDVDAIESGEPENVDVVAKIKAQFPEITLQVIGGITCIESAYVWVDAGVDFLVLSSRSSRNRDFLDDMCVEYPNKIMVELDCRSGLNGQGGEHQNSRLVNYARRLEEDGVVGVVLTDNAKGVNGESFQAIQSLVNQLEIEVFTNGVIADMSDLDQILGTGVDLPDGILIGKSIYNGNICLATANTQLAQHEHRKVS